MRGRRLFVDVTPLRASAQFRRLWGGYLVSSVGTQLTVVAVPYQIFRLTHSSLDVGLIGLVQIVPVLGGALVGGAIADALDRRTVLMFSQTLLSFCSIGLLVNALSPHPLIWPLYVCAAGIGGLASVDGSTRTAVFANLVDRRMLPAANSLWQLLFQVGQVAGPAVGGVLIGRIGVASAYAVDAATFAVSLSAVVSLGRLVPLEGGTPFGWESIKEGLRFIRGRKELQGAFVIDLDAMILGMPRALFPAIGLVRFRGGAQTVGLLYSAPGVGALLGAALTGWVSSVRRQGRAVLISVALWGLSIAAFGMVPWLAPALVLLGVAGAADVVSAVFRGTILQTATPDSLRGRLSALHTAVVTGGPRLGDVEAGAVAALAGVEASVVSGGLGCLAGVVVVRWLMPRFAGYVAPAPDVPEAEPGLEPA